MLAGATRIRTKQGWQSIVSRVTDHNVSEVTDTCVYTFCLARGGPSKKLWTVAAARPHQWPLMTGKSTWDLRIGDVVCANDEDCGYNKLGWLHGFLKRQGHGSEWYSLTAEYAKKYRGRLEEMAIKKEKINGEWQFKFPDIRFSDLPNSWDESYSSAYVGSFIRGFMDGAKSSEAVSTNDLATAEWLQLYAPFGGYVPSGEITSSLKINRHSMPSKSTFHNAYHLSLVRGDTHAGFRVRDVRVVREPVAVCHYPIVEKLCLEGGIATYP